MKTNVLETKQVVPMTPPAVVCMMAAMAAVLLRMLSAVRILFTAVLVDSPVTL